jgi:hypothetical protein
MSAIAAEAPRRRPEWDTFKVWTAALTISRQRVSKRSEAR